MSVQRAASIGENTSTRSTVGIGGTPSGSGKPGMFVLIHLKLDSFQINITVRGLGDGQ